MGWLKGLRGLSEAEVFRVEASDLPDFGLCEGRRLGGADVLLDLRTRLRTRDCDRRLLEGKDELQGGLGHRPIRFLQEREPFRDRGAARNHRRRPMMPDVPGRERGIGTDTAREEPIPQRLVGDDSETRPCRFPEDFCYSLLAKQAERNLERLGRAGLETKQRFDWLVGGLPRRCARL